MYGTSEMHTEIWWGNLQERKYLEVLGLGRRMTLK